MQIIKFHNQDIQVSPRDETDVKVAVGALSGKTGERLLKISEDSHNHRILPDGVVSDPSDMAKITTWTLRDFCAKNKIKNISLLKMDIEGAEFEVFASLAPEDYLLFKNVILEYHDNRQRNHHLIESLLRENGFGVQKFPSKFDKTMGFIFANNKRLK